MMTSAVAEAAAGSGGIEVSLRVKGNSQPMSARTVSIPLIAANGSTSIVSVPIRF